MSPMAVGAIFGDERTYRDRDGAAFRRVQAALQQIAVPDDVEIQLIYAFTGSLSSPDWTGLKVSGRTQRGITVDVAVPAGWQDEDDLVAMGREAIREAVGRLTAEAKGSRRQRSSLPVTDDNDDAHLVAVSLPIDRLSVEVLHALEDEAGRYLQQARLGKVAGHELGGGTFELFVETEPANEVRVREAIMGLYTAATRRSAEADREAT